MVWRKIPSSAAFGQIGEAYVKAIHRFAERHHIPMVHFQKGQNKEEVARPYLEAAAREGQDVDTAANPGCRANMRRA